MLWLVYSSCILNSAIHFWKFRLNTSYYIFLNARLVTCREVGGHMTHCILYYWAVD